MGRDADRVVGAAGEPVRAVFDSYLAQDRAAAERLAAEDFVFTSPQGDDVFALYEYELEGGQRYRNTEVITVQDGRLTESQVFFGGRV